MGDIDITRDHVIETLVAAGTFVGGVAITLILVSLMQRVIHRFTHARERRLDEQLARSLRLPVQLFFIAIAAFIALRTLSYLDPHRSSLQRLWTATALALGVLFVQRLVAGLLRWAESNARQRGAESMDKALPLLRRTFNVITLLLGILLVLDQLGVAISPLLAGLGITGLAVAWALQPLLTNLFAGSYVMSDGSIRVGDFVVLRDGPSGRVEEIGWRITRLRSTEGLEIIVPNATLASATITNHGIGRAEEVSVVYGVPQGHDLERVEALATEVLRAVVAERDEAVKHFEPRVRFQGLGESRVDCQLTLQARSRAEAPLLTHELVKRLHARLRSEGIIAAPAEAEASP